MKPPLFATALVCAFSLGLGNAALAAPTPTPAATPAVAPYNGLLLGSKIIGSHIKNLQNQDIGTIDDVIVNPDTGRVRFAVLGVGGFVGIDQTKVIVPWGAVGLEKNQPGDAPSYVIDATKDRLEKAPKFDSTKLSDLYAASNAQPIFDYYDIIFFDDVPAAGQTTGAKAKTSAATPTPSPTASPKSGH
jgi:hypothetical protein